MEILILLLMAIFAILSSVATYLAISERDLLTAVIYSAIQSTAYAIIFYLLMAPDIVLVYIPVAIGLYPAVFTILIKKSQRFEVKEHEV